MTRLCLDDPEVGRAAALAELARAGFVVVAAGATWLEADACARDPWAVVERLVGRAPRMVERQPIRPVPGARSVAASDGDAPLHTDSQPFRGLPAHLQVMACRAPAAEGGESLLVDAFDLCEQLAARDPGLLSALSTTPRRHSFYFGAETRPTLCRSGAELYVTHQPVARDDLGVRLARALPPPLRVGVARGEVLLVDNHRMLHGRDAFQGARSFERVLAWLDAPLSPAHPLRARVGLGEVAPCAVDPRERALAALLRGVPPGIVAAQTGVPEPELYALRTAAFDAALRPSPR
ncbi:MAG: TauD/TfdA family dioxygenase [Polyangiaceae bacterium]|nr:TauD/TfdA family dioxygenase [Polyangiaceae bacterium]